VELKKNIGALKDNASVLINQIGRKRVPSFHFILSVTPRRLLNVLECDTNFMEADKERST
jgi:hypothetical protein